MDNDRWGNYWLAKERAVNKIDAAIALCMAVGAALRPSSSSLTQLRLNGCFATA